MRSLLFLLIFSNLVFGFVPAPPAAPQVVDTSIQMYTEEIKQTAQDASKQYNELAKDKDGSEEKIRYFDDFVEPMICEGLEALKCPSLKPEYLNKFSVSRTNIDLSSGSFECQVYDFEKTQNFNKLGHVKPFYSQSYKAKSCVREFDQKLNAIEADTNEVQAARAMIQSKQDELINIETSFKNDYVDSKYLDLGDWLDVLSTVDTEKIDIETTLAQWDVTLKNGYTRTVNSAVIEDFKGDVADLISYYNGDLSVDEIDKEILTKAQYSESSKIMQNSNFVGYFDFFISSNETMRDALTYVLIMAMSWTLIANYGFNSLTQRFGPGGQDQENHLGRIGFGVAIFFLFFVGTSENINIKTGHGVEETVKELEVKEFRIQTALRLLYSLTNELQDELTIDATHSYLRGLSANLNFGSADMLDSLTQERVVLNKKHKLLKEINAQCIGTYNQSALLDRMTTYYSQTDQLQEAQSTKTEIKSRGIATSYHSTKTTVKDFSNLTLNPYPRSEGEAYRIGKGVSGTGGSLYREYEDGGVVNDGYFENQTFKTNFVKLSDCFSNKKQMIQNRTRLSEVESKINYLMTESNYTNKLEALKKIHKLVWKSNAELGYLSVAMLPMAQLMSADMKVIGTGAEIEELKDTGDVEIAKSISMAVPSLTLFGGYQVGNLVNRVLNTLADGMVAVPGLGYLTKVKDVFFSDAQSSPGIVSFLIANEIIVQILESMVLVLLVTGSILSFVILSLQKAWAFLSTMFYAIFLFRQDSERKLAESMSKVIVIAFKGVLLVVSIVTANYAVNLMDSLQHVLVNDYLGNMESIYAVDRQLTTADQNWDKTIPTIDYILTSLQQYMTVYVNMGVVAVGFMIAKIYLTYHILFKLPDFFNELIGLGGSIIQNNLENTIAGALEGQNLKGL